MPKIVMYHYIRKKNKEFPYFRFLNVKNFEKQINILGKKNIFLKIGEDFLDLLNKTNKITLSFDDGLSEHYSIAKYLSEINILGYFFIPSYPYINKDFLSPHKIHILLGKYDVDEISDYINKFIKDNNIRIKNKYLFTSKDLQLSKTKSDKLKKFFC